MEQRTLQIEDEWGQHRIHYLQYGQKSANPPVVCVHGLTRNAFDFQFLAASLAKAGRWVLAPDIVGRGGSSWLDDPAGYRIETYCGHMLAWLDALELGKVDWIGTSMGGLIALGIAPAGRFNSLILNDIGPHVPKSAMEMISAYLGLELFFDSVDEIELHLRQVHAPFGNLSDSQWRHLAEHSARQSGERWQLHYDPQIRVNFAEAAQDDIGIWELWQQVTCPTLILRGKESALLDPPTLQRMLQERPNARAVEIDHAGHAPALMDEAQIELVSRFLMEQA